MKRHTARGPLFPIAAILIAGAAVFAAGIWHSATNAKTMRQTQPSIGQGPVEHQRSRITNIDRAVLKSIIERAMERKNEQ